MYAYNTFDFNQMYTLFGFERTVPSYRWNLIRSVRLYTYFPFNFYRYTITDDAQQADDSEEAMAWNKTCKVLASMGGLRYLKIVLKGINDRWDEEGLRTVAKFLEPLTTIKCRGRFTVEVPWPYGATAATSHGSFEIVRPDVEETR